ncbi:5-oxoprolinase/urea amidolyase family protein [Corticibacter populi]|uniref:5-oxoprolinase/urea amidolyase family protein n=1 Tax=Corticibacter populi TaxID=1550736 RepID=A0A3M6QV45_9BURK|nr:urea amidolyase family protein [Corticibacter populi]RMX06904.1 5-oxoprolinase/urea amidolyase family protein [Corticibacter populi]
MRFLPASDTALLVELADLHETLALFESLQAAPLAGVHEAVPAARTILLEFHPHRTSAAQLATQLQQRASRLAGMRSGRQAEPAGRLVEIPVDYCGEDLEDLASQLGLTPAQLIERHTGFEYQAAFAGFAPGFVYLAGNPFGAPIPRRLTPRTRVPASSVALAGDFSAVYPKDSPGGWQLLGITPCQMWDMRRAEPALVQPGFRVRFVDQAGAGRGIHLPGEVQAPAPVPVTLPGAAGEAIGVAGKQAEAPQVRPRAVPWSAQLRVQSAGLQTLVQDLGRFGKTGMGVSVSGALDRAALRAANRLVGNPSDAAVLENALGQLRLECAAGAAVVGISGAQVPVSIVTAAGQRLQAGIGAPLALDAGDVLEIGALQAGVRVYLAVRGGLDIAPVLGSRASDTLAVIGPAPLRAGDVLHVGEAIAASQLQAVPPASDIASAEATAALPRPGEVVTLDVVLGPRTDWFAPEALARLAEQEWVVTPQSNRVGIRLAGTEPLTRRAAFATAELPSEGTVAGAIQVPASGQPVLFLADHPLTGGYPVIGAVASHDLDRCAQIPVGARLRFRVLAPFAEVRPAQQTVALTAASTD